MPDMPKVRKIKSAVSLQYLKKELSYEVDVLQADKHESLLQVDSIFLMGLARHAQATQVNLQYLRDILKKSGMKFGA